MNNFLTVGSKNVFRGCLLRLLKELAPVRVERTLANVVLQEF